MRAAVGLPSPERLIGLSAHDFQQAMGAPAVILTRAARDAEAPTVASRWLLRLGNLLAGLGPEGQARPRRRPGPRHATGSPSRAASTARRPCAPPPRRARLRARRPRPARAELSVTQIERLVRDPYAIYAAKVLRLRRLDPPGRSPTRSSRGTRHPRRPRRLRYRNRRGPAARRRGGLPRRRHAALAAAAPWPAVNAIWAGRLERSARWFLDGEAARRARGHPRRPRDRGRRAVDGLAQPFAVTAKADRLDRTPDGRFAIYDYKSGDAPSAAEAEAFHLQLPLEAAIAAAGGFEGLPAGPGRPPRTPRASAAARAPPSTAIPTPSPRSGSASAPSSPPTRTPPPPSSPACARGSSTYPGDYDHLARNGEWSDGDDPDEGEP